MPQDSSSCILTLSLSLSLSPCPPPLSLYLPLSLPSLSLSPSILLFLSLSLYFSLLSLCLLVFAGGAVGVVSEFDCPQTLAQAGTLVHSALCFPSEAKQRGNLPLEDNKHLSRHH